MDYAEEKIIWTESAGIADFKVYPVYWVLTLVTAGFYLLYVYLVRVYTRYTLTDQRLIKEWGILQKGRDDIELFRVKDTTVRSGFFQRLVGYGDISVVSSDRTGPVVLENMPDAFNKREKIREMSNRARERAGLRTLVSE